MKTEVPLTLLQVYAFGTVVVAVLAIMTRFVQHMENNSSKRDHALAAKAFFLCWAWPVGLLCAIGAAVRWLWRETGWQSGKSHFREGGPL